VSFTPQSRIVETHNVIILLLAEDKAKLGMFVVDFIQLGSEDNHDAILQEIVVVDRIRVQTLALDVVCPAWWRQFTTETVFG
jgi:hypothetical protein